jgi:hypothetical protein
VTVSDDYEPKLPPLNDAEFSGHRIAKHQHLESIEEVRDYLDPPPPVGHCLSPSGATNRAVFYNHWGPWEPGVGHIEFTESGIKLVPDPPPPDYAGRPWGWGWRPLIENVTELMYFWALPECEKFEGGGGI